MNNILEMIRNEKVEWKKLGDVCEFKRGNTITKKHVKQGMVPVVAGGQQPAYYHNESNRMGETIAIAGSGVNAGYVSFWDIPIFLSDAFSVEPSNLILVKYLYYFLSSKQFEIYNLKQGCGIPHVYPNDLARLEIPIPSMETQERIVKILDTMVDHFTQIKAELQARNSQYEYYRDKLLSEEYLNKLSEKFGGKVEYEELGEIGEFYGGLTGKNKSDFINGNERFITYKNVFDNISTNIYSEDLVKINSGEKQRELSIADIIFTGSSEIEEESGYSSVITEHVNHPLYLNSFCFFLRLNDNDILIPDFSKFLFRSKEVRKQIIKTASGVTRFNVSKVLMKKVTIPVPPIPVQEHIVSILDDFNKIVSDINEGLPKDIELRQKQYEYYRERLLDFKKEED